MHTNLLLNGMKLIISIDHAADAISSVHTSMPLIIAARGVPEIILNQKLIFEILYPER